MYNLDKAIAQMKSTECINCKMEDAIFDEDGTKVTITGSFCEPASGNQMIDIRAVDKNSGVEIWKKECETGRTCSIPFTSDDEFKCW